MTPEERDLLTRFLDDLARSRPQAKDTEAAQQIEGALRSNPDAAYVLVQHAILSDHALQDAQARIADLEDQLRGGPPMPEPQEPGFLGALFGKGAPPNPPGVGQAGPWGARGGSAVPPTSAPPNAYAAGAYRGGYDAPPPQSGPFSGGGGLGGFLRNAGTTAAGVAGGAFLFEGLSGLFDHRSGFGGGYGFEGGAPVENTVINEYGGSERDGGGVDYDSDNGDLTGDDYS